MLSKFGLASNPEIEKLVRRLDDEEILRLIRSYPPAPYYMAHVEEEAKKRRLL